MAKRGFAILGSKRQIAWTLLAVIVPILCACSLRPTGEEGRDSAAMDTAAATKDVQPVYFDWFEYRGNDPMFAAPLAPGEFQNPILAGFYPDPSIVYAEDAYYMVTSSFSYYPGIPLFRSTDLVNWQQLGHVLTRPSQLKLHEVGVSRGIYAPTIRYHQGTFYVISTAVDSGGGNFIVTTRDPAGEWSDPIYLPEINGIDPDLFFDDDGKVYIAHNGPPIGEPLYQGHRAIWLWQYDLGTQKVMAGTGRVIVNGGVDLASEPVWIEAPHIYRVDGWYYLLCAEGGTSDQHSEVVFRTRSLDKPFSPYSGNPILTQRDLDPNRANPVATAGHADLVQTPAGDWWAVFLATRNYQQRHFNTGRETFLLPVKWRDGWPIILPKGELVALRSEAPALPITNTRTINVNSRAGIQPTTGNFIWRDDFDGEVLSMPWNMLRTPSEGWYSFDAGKLAITGGSNDLSSLAQPAFLGRRLQHQNAVATTSLAVPSSPKLRAGLAAFQSEQAYYYLAVERVGSDLSVSVWRQNGVNSDRVVQRQLTSGLDGIELRVEIALDRISFSYKTDKLNSVGSWVTLVENLDAKILSTAQAGGFVGSYLGLHVVNTDD
jgi:Beta-xylosidase